MVWALTFEILKPLPSLIYALSIPLNEQCGFIPQLYSLARRKILAEEGLGEHHPSGE